MSKPFDGNGLTLRQSFDLLHQKTSSTRFKNIRQIVEKGLECYLTIQTESSPILVAGSAMNLFSLGMDVLWAPLASKRSRVPAQAAFEEEADGGQILADFAVSPILIPLLDLDKMFMVMRNEPSNESSSTFWKYEYSKGKYLVWLEEDGSQSYIILPKKFEGDEKEVRKILRDAMWKPLADHIEIQYDKHKEQITFADKQTIPWNYEGEQGDKLIARWKKFYAQNMRRSVILHGPPGTGKSTLAQQAAREMNGRICYISVQILAEVSIHTLLSLLDLFTPDIFIVDDLDRMEEKDLNFFLNFFEESEESIPLLIATTNHLSNLPDALKRPGRFDEIWAIEPPKGEIRLRVIHYLAQLEDVILSEEAASKLMEITEEQALPGAHVRELIRRIKVMGEGELDFDPTDLTFDDEWSHDDSMEPINNDHGSKGPAPGIPRLSPCDPYDDPYDDDDDDDDNEGWNY